MNFLTFNQGISILLENPADIDLAFELVVALRSRLARKGGRGGRVSVSCEAGKEPLVPEFRGGAGSAAGEQGDHAAEGDLVLAVDDEAHEGRNILDVVLLEEAQSVSLRSFTKSGVKPWIPRHPTDASPSTPRPDGIPRWGT